MAEEIGEQQMGEVIKLVANDGAEFIIEVVYAEISEFIKHALMTDTSESHSKTISFPEISGPVLEKVIEYLHYKFKYQNLINQGMSKDQVP
jgi:transcription elongation factor B subunit 1